MIDCFSEDSRPFVRAVCALSLAPALEEHDGKTGELVQALTKLYHEKVRQISNDIVVY